MKILENLKKNTLLLLIITVVVLYIILKDDFFGIIETINNMDKKYIILAMLFYFFSVIIKGYVNYLIINDSTKVSKKEAIRQNFIAQFFNGITPFSTGGEPMGVYMLMENGIPFAKATNYMVQSFVFYQVALVICGMIAVIYNFIFKIFPTVRLLQHLVLLGFTINTIVVILLLLSYSKTATEKMSKITYAIVRKLKLKHTKEEINQKFEDYYNGFQELKNRKTLFFIGIILNIVSLVCLYSVPLWIILGMENHISITVMETLVSSSYVYLIGAFVPVPGASGGMEYGFSQFFGNFIKTSEVSAIMIVWRFITYYLGITVGGIIFNIRKKGE